MVGDVVAGFAMLQVAARMAMIFHAMHKGKRVHRRRNNDLPLP